NKPPCAGSFIGHFCSDLATVRIPVLIVFLFVLTFSAHDLLPFVHGFIYQLLSFLPSVSSQGNFCTLLDVLSLPSYLQIDRQVGQHLSFLSYEIFGVHTFPNN
ncbi:hypothetical protein U1Q18_051556, partial [Sarracenia purpurea var. burkii]